MMTNAAKLQLGVGLGCGAAVLLGLFAVGVVAVRSRRAAAAAQARDSTKMERITAEELLKAYRESDTAADRRFKHYLTEISGTVDSVARGAVGGEFVTLRGSEGLWQVQCFAADGESFASLHREASVTLRGRVQGKFGNVLVEDCKIV
jgi:hypothetical protein